MKFVKNELLKKDPSFFANYEEKREAGENDSYICSLIRQDSIKDIIINLTRQNIETNPFLIENKNTTLIKYSAFFGSIQIFRYLLMNKAELTPSLWLYTIHSKNAELIHLLESNEVPPPKIESEEKEEEEEENSNKNYERCFIESIKCHHNDIADYIENNFLGQTKIDPQQNEEIILNCIKYRNYLHFQIDSIIDHGLFYLSFYHYNKLFELSLKKKEKSIKEKMIQCPDIGTAAEKNEVEVIYSFLLQMQEIPEKLFYSTKIKQIIVPSSVTKIGNDAFLECSSLIQIAIHSSISEIGDNAFYECSSLTQMTFPSSIIGKGAFSRCLSLTQITIPSSATPIGDCAFYECSSLTQITIPSFVTKVGDSIFCGCSLLTQIIISPCSKRALNYIAEKILVFKSNLESEIFDTLLWINLFKCSSLTQITIPSSVTLIGGDAFCGFSLLTQITIPSSVTSIGDFAFSGCSSLTQITIPSSVTEIRNYAFCRCSSLTQITIPSSVTSIGNYTFYGCSSLTQITIQSSIYQNNLGISESVDIITF